MAFSTTDIDQLTGATVRGTDDDKIGSIGQVYVDPDGTPTWATVRTGLFGTSESFIPLDSAGFDGKDVTVPFTKDIVKDAPRVDSDGELNENETDGLYDYYAGHGSASGTGATSGTGTTGSTADYDTTRTPRDAGTDSTAGYDADTTPGYDLDAGRGTGQRDETTRPHEGHDTSGPTTDDAMTRSEERLDVGTKRVETGRARLRKHVVTEQQTVTVPVSHDEVTVTREPISAENMGEAMAGGDLTEEEHEVVLTADQVVTSKETVPVERIKLGTQTVTEQQQVTEDVRKEQIDSIDADGTVTTIGQ